MNRLRATTGAPVLEIAVPVYNDERVLEQNVGALHAFVDEHIPFSTRITVVDNASDDATSARRVAAGLSGMHGWRVRPHAQPARAREAR